ncbi:EthD domain-containing protein [Pseudonocardia sp. NPDC049635]|uniref:EthD domain-containing protein n=1 Tax=Pseudonocardia sp. NPDC049635 TaxID=3155506 RepID=UPI0033F96900
MFSTILTIRKRRDISREDFIDYYENTHTALIGRLLPATILQYRRNYIIDEAPLSRRLAEGRGDDTELPDIAVITEARFATREDAEALVDAFLSDDVLPRVLADESNFIEPGGVRWRVVEVYE